jgi:hypothetical protein
MKNYLNWFLNFIIPEKSRLLDDFQFSTTLGHPEVSGRVGFIRGIDERGLQEHVCAATRSYLSRRRKSDHGAYMATEGGEGI